MAKIKKVKDEYHCNGIRMWKVENTRYRFQSEDKSVNAKLKRRKKFKIFGYQVNGPLMLFDAEFTTLQKAKSVLSNIGSET